tara:strand:+ start:73 stop:330 length:258 start_codon:yes stop_codon:yes gene_type:complete
MTRQKLMDLINEQMPEVMAAPSEDFDGCAGGMWFRGSEDFHEDNYIFDIYADNDTGGVHPKLAALLKRHGWYSEPYDSGTLMAWQ